MLNIADVATELKVASVQFEPLVGARADNLVAIERLVRNAAELGAQLIVLPELSDSGYVFDSRAEAAQMATSVPDGASVDKLLALARELRVYIACGLDELDGDKLFNSAVLCGPAGLIGKYRKLHLWDQENAYFSKGDLDLPVFDTPLGRIGLLICYDGWFPETFRRLALSGADLVCVPTNWVPMAGHDTRDEAMANILLKAAACTNGIYIASANRIGLERGQLFIGRSLIVGPDGWPVAGPASGDAEEILLVDIDLAKCAQSRSVNSRNHLLRDRRDDVYRQLDIT